ncbi:MAG: hypothetical protein GKR88_05260 [Flavobacteriaceae bacterium]|nr:MAG: hypothetical protein GKR88_05260 [Flavobacteriaceae bacterium]
MKTKFIFLLVVFALHIECVRKSEAKHSSFAKGIDISKYQRTIHWTDLVKQKEMAFIIARATEGMAIDDSFSKHWKEIHKIDCIGGAYHFFSNEESPLLQAKLFLETVPVKKGNLPPILDVEAYSTIQTKHQLIENCLTWLTYVEKATGRTPILYSNLYFITNNLSDPRLRKYPLWIAEYNSDSIPKVPEIWDTWLFWQKSDSYLLKGIQGDVDYDLFHGSKEDLQNYSNKE